MATKNSTTLCPICVERKSLSPRTIVKGSKACSRHNLEFFTKEKHDAVHIKKNLTSLAERVKRQRNYDEEIAQELATKMVTLEEEQSKIEFQSKAIDSIFSDAHSDWNSLFNRPSPMETAQQNPEEVYKKATIEVEAKYIPELEKTRAYLAQVLQEKERMEKEAMAKFNELTTEKISTTDCLHWLVSELLTAHPTTTRAIKKKMEANSDPRLNILREPFKSVTVENC